MLRCLTFVLVAALAGCAPERLVVGVWPTTSAGSTASSNMGSGSSGTTTGAIGTGSSGTSGDSGPPCVPVQSPIGACAESSQCCPNTLGLPVACNNSICCNKDQGSCSDDNDCCNGLSCVPLDTGGGRCAVNVDHFHCDVAADCESGVCGATDSGVPNWCVCISVGLPSPTDVGCCSDQRDNGGLCETSTLHASCPATTCNPNSEACQGGQCCLSEHGSTIEPCFVASDCCRSGSITLACLANTCCNDRDRPGATNQDCCAGYVCSDKGQCKILSGFTPCSQDADCISLSCDLKDGVCN
jgi:hypothetical protein